LGTGDWGLGKNYYLTGSHQSAVKNKTLKTASNAIFKCFVEVKPSVC
jgi:hypothetical protein